MATTQIAEGLPTHPGWRFQEYFWANVHGWFNEATQRGAFVRAGPDCWERAQALLATSDAKMIHDATAAAWREATRGAFLTHAHRLRGESRPRRHKPVRRPDAHR